VNLLDLPGPAFLGAYVVLILVTTAISIALRFWATAPGGKLYQADLEYLHPYEIGYLRDGAAGAVTAALAALVHRGRVRVDESRLAPGSIGVAGARELVAPGVYRSFEAPPADHPLEREIEEAVRREPRTFRELVEETPSARRLGERLQQVGLMCSTAGLVARNLVIRVPLALVLLLGLAKIAVGMSRGRSVGFLIALVWLVFMVAVFVHVKRRRSRRGDFALESFGIGTRALTATAASAPQQLDDRGVALAAAVSGSSVRGSNFMGLVGAVPPSTETTTTSAWASLMSGMSAHSGGSSSSSSSWSSVSTCGSGSSCGGGGGGGGCGGCA
jgi:uncharacterized protein (TIGR04222 family)